MYHEQLRAALQHQVRCLRWLETSSGEGSGAMRHGSQPKYFTLAFPRRVLARSIGKTNLS